MTIWKFKLDVVGSQRIELPAGSQILSVQEQGGDMQCWALVNPDAGLELRTIVIVGTGAPVPKKDMRFIETVQMLGGLYIWHVFEVL